MLRISQTLLGQLKLQESHESYGLHQLVAEIPIRELLFRFEADDVGLEDVVLALLEDLAAGEEPAVSGTGILGEKFASQWDGRRVMLYHI